MAINNAETIWNINGQEALEKIEKIEQNPINPKKHPARFARIVAEWKVASVPVKLLLSLEEKIGEHNLDKRNPKSIIGLPQK